MIEVNKIIGNSKILHLHTPVKLFSNLSNDTNGMSKSHL